MTPDEIEHLARLARIELTEEEKISLVADMKSILGFIDAIKQADVTIDGSARIGAVRNVFRPDDTPYEGGLYTDVLLAAAPATETGFVKVKKIL